MSGQRFIQTCLILSLMFCFSSQSAQAVTFLGKAKTGKLEISDYHYPVALYVPETYDAAKTYPFLIALPDIAEDPSKHLEEWMSLAKRKNLIVLVPSLQIRVTETPYKTDEWLLKLKSDIEKQYRIDKDRIFLAGKNQGAHYAAYLGIKFPEEFSAVIMIGGSWSGPFERLLTLNGKPLKQRPFLAIVDQDDAGLIEGSEQVAYKMTQKGYPVYLKKVSKDALELKDTRKEALDWAEEKQIAWNHQLDENRKTFRARVDKVFHDFFEIQKQ